MRPFDGNFILSVWSSNQGLHQVFFGEGATGLKNLVQRVTGVHEQFLVILAQEVEIVHSKTVFRHLLHLLCLGAVVELVPASPEYPIGNTVMESLKQTSYYTVLVIEDLSCSDD